MRDLTADEQNCLNHLGEIANQYKTLPVVHEADLAEFVAAIHAAQNIILARPATEVQMRLREERLRNRTHK